MFKTSKTRPGKEQRARTRREAKRRHDLRTRIDKINERINKQEDTQND